MTQTALLAAAGLLLFIVACAAFFIVGRRMGRTGETARQARAQSTAEETAKRVLDEAARDAESLRKTAVLTGKEELIRLREDWEQEARKRREEIEREERRVQERESLLNRKYELLEQREKDAAVQTTSLNARQQAMSGREQELDRLVGEERRRLEQLAGLSAQEAKAELIHRLEDEAQADAANRIRDIRDTAKRNADREAKKIIALAIQRIAAEQTAETTVPAVALLRGGAADFRIVGLSSNLLTAMRLLVVVQLGTAPRGAI